MPPTVVPSEGAYGRQKISKPTKEKYNNKTSNSHANIHPNAAISFCLPHVLQKIPKQLIYSSYKESSVLLTLKAAKIITGFQVEETTVLNSEKQMTVTVLLLYIPVPSLSSPLY